MLTKSQSCMNTALFAGTCRISSRDCVQLLLDAGLSATDADVRGCTPLHVCRCCDMAGMLQRAGAHVGALCSAGATPLHWAAAGAGRMCELFT